MLELLGADMPLRPMRLGGELRKLVRRSPPGRDMGLMISDARQSALLNLAVLSGRSLALVQALHQRVGDRSGISPSVSAGSSGLSIC